MMVGELCVDFNPFQREFHQDSTDLLSIVAANAIFCRIQQQQQQCFLDSMLLPPPPHVYYTTKVQKCCRWVKPDLGCIKLNTDGSIDKINGRFGGIFRDDNGIPIFGFVKRSSFQNNIFLVELEAILEGLRFAKSMGIQVIWIESDSESVVKTINRQQPYRGKEGHDCLNGIWDLLSKFVYNVSHTWREANKAADCLSKMVVNGDEVRLLWPNEFPRNLKKIIKEDAQGKIYHRQ